MKAARIVVLVVAVAAGGVAALLAGRQEVPEAPPPPEPVAKLDTVEVLTAKSDIGIGHAVSAQELQWQTWPTSAAGPSFIRKNNRPDAVEQLSGLTARAPFAAGEPINEVKLIKGTGGYMAAILPPGMRAISTEISAESGAGGFILPQDRVDVILSRRDKEAEKSLGVDTYISETILNNVRVLAIDQAVEEKNGQRVAVGKTATLELTPRQAETLAVARQMGTLSLVLRSLADGKAISNDEKPDKSRGGINTVRFGVSTTTK